MGRQFDSTKEANRYVNLMELEEAGCISNLRLQVKYELTPTFREPDEVGPKGGVKKGKVILNASYYVADFVYVDNETGQEVVEDTKGFRTKDFIPKKKVMYMRYGILIKEI